MLGMIRYDSHPRWNAENLVSNRRGTENTYMAINRKCSELEPMG